MTDTNITGNQTTAVTLKDGNNGVDDTLTVGASGQLKTTATAVVMNLTAAPAGAGVVITNNGTIQSTGDRTLDTTGAAAGSKITLNNNGSIISSGPSKADVFRVADDIVNGVITVNNTGTIQSTGQTNDSQGLRFGKSYNSTITINNSATGKILTANADAIRAGNNSTITNYGTITANASSVPSAKNPANAIDISAAQSSTVINHGGTITGAGSGLGTDVGNNSPSGATTAPNYNVTNDQGGVITGQVAAGIASGGTATIVNSGTIQGLGLSSLPGGATATAYDGDGVNVTGVATITNTGTIQGVRSAGVSAVTGRNNISEGVVIGGGVVTNSGTIEGGYAGVTVDNVQNTNQTRSGSAALNLTNQAGGVIKGDNGYAIRSENKTADGSAKAALTNDTITNYGTIIGNGAIPSGTVNLGTGAADPNTVGTLDGVAYTSAGNAGSARFILGDGSAIQTGEGDDVVNNYGSIVGNSGRAINLEGGADTLNLFTGQSIVGRIDGGAGNDTITLNVGSSASMGALANVVNVENLNVRGGSWTLSDAQSYSNGVKIAAGATLTLGTAGSLGGAIVDNGSLVSSNAGAVTITDAVSGTGSITQSGAGVLTLSGANSYSGGTALNAGALDVASATGAGSGAITFGAGAQTLDIELGALTGSGSTAQFGNTLAGFGAGDVIDLRGVGAATSASYDASTGQLTIAGGSTTVVLTLDASSAPAAGFAFGVTSDGAGGTTVALDRIATVGSVSAASATPYVKAGDSFTISIAMDKPVTISGDAPSLSLSDGGVAIYDASRSTATSLVFVATVAAGQNANGVSIIGVTNGSSVIDASHVPVNLSGALNLAPVGPTIDTIAPDVSISSAGGLTNSPEQTVSGVASEGGVGVVLYEGTTEIGRTVADAQGQWSVDVTLSGNGEHPVHAVATDAAGNAGSSEDIVYRLDTVAPTVTVTTATQLTNNPSLTISGSVDVATNADAIGTTVSVFDGSVVVGTGVVQDDGSWSATVTLSGDGQHTLKASDTDQANNTGYSAPFTITLDTQAPDTGLTSQPALVTNATDASFVFSGTDTAGGSGVTGFLVSVDGGDFAAASSALTLHGLADGSHSIAVKAVDAAGNVDASPAVYTWTVDTIAPDTVLTGRPAAISNSSSAHFDLSGSDPNGSGVTSYLVSVDGGSFASNSTSAVDLANLSEGAHTISVKAVDAAGNVDATPATYAWNVDTIAPDTSISARPAKTTNVTTAHFDFTGTDGSGSGVTGFLASVDGGAYQAVNGSSLDLAGLSEGAHSVSVKAIDAAGNVDATPASYSWTVDTTAAQVGFTSTGGVIHTGQQVISGAVDASEAGRIVTIRDGQTVIGTTKISSDGRFATSVILTGEGEHHVTATETDAAGNVGVSDDLEFDLDSSAPTFVKGNLVLSVYGNGDGSGDYDDNEASPITLQQFTTAGEYINQIVLPQATIGRNSVISGELGSSSEGSLQLTVNGRALLIAGYGVNALEYNDGGAAVYGDDALAQTTSLTNQANFIPVSRVIALISPDGSVDTSTSLFNIFNGNNPRSVASLDGQTLYISGQGQAGDTTQGVFVTQLGSSTATAIDNSTDTRTAVIYNGQLYISRDSKQPKTGSLQGTANITVFNTLPNGQQTPTVLTGIDRSVRLTANQTNTINHAGQTVNLDPNNFFFANSTTLYVADGGIAKIGGIGDGGLQKWTLNGTTGRWELQYTLSQGLGIVGQGAAYGTTGLICLTGRVVGDTVQLYATNQTVGDLDQKYLFGITDHLSDTTGAGKSFTTLVTAAAGTNIRGVSFAPTTDAPTIEFDSDGGLTNLPSFVLTGTVDLADAGTTVVIKDGNASIGTALVGMDGTWSMNVTLSGEGKHTLVASDTDVYGNTGTNTIAFTLDTVAPDVAISSGGGLTNAVRQAINGTGEAGSTVTLYEGGTAIATAVVGRTGTWRTTVTLSGDGVHTITAKATDAAGNVGAGGTIKFTLDTTAPAAPTIALLNDTGSSSSDRITNDPRLNVTAADAGDTLLYLVDGAKAFTEGMPSITGEGQHVVYVRERDAAGNLSAASKLIFTLDTIAPAAALTSAGGLTRSATQTISGTGEAGAKITLYEGSNVVATATVGRTGAWSTSVTLGGDGLHTLTATATDAAGNVGAGGSIKFTLDTLAPDVAFTSTGGLTNASQQKITGTGEAGSKITLYEGSTAIGTATVGRTGSWVATVSLKGDGVHSITATATDAAGNVGAGGTISFTLDATAPGAPKISLRNDTGAYATDRITSDARLLVSPSEAGDTLLFAVDGAKTFTEGLPTITGDGVHTVAVRERDAAGNLSAVSKLVFTLDTHAPNVRISNSGGTVAGSRQSISGVGEAGSVVEVFDGSKSLGSVKVGADGSWTRTIAITGAGKHVITAVDTDRAGNVGTSQSVTYTVPSASSLNSLVQAMSTTGASSAGALAVSAPSATSQEHALAAAHG